MVSWLAASSAAISRARAVREVNGIKWCFSACWAEIKRSHSSAMAWARCGFEGGMVRIFFAGVRTGRESRKI